MNEENSAFGSFDQQLNDTPTSSNTFVFAINQQVTNIVIMVRDITDVSEIFIDDLLVIGQPPDSQPPTLSSISVTTNGNNITLSVTAGDTLPFYSQWQLNGNGIPGATNSFSAGTATITYTITNAQPFNSGNYQVVVANAVASEESPAFDLTVDLGTPITTNNNLASSLPFNPLAGAVAGSNSSSSIPPIDGPTNIAGKPAAGFLWYNWTASFSGVISLTTRGSSFDTLLGVYTGSALDSLTTVAEDDDSGGFFTSLVTFNCVQGTTYQIAVAGYRGATGSVVLQLSPGPPLLPGPANGYSIGGPVPMITQQPTNQIVHSNQTVTLGVTASDATSYQWYFTNAPVAGGTASTLVITNFQAIAVGNYFVQVSNAVGAVLSDIATIEIAAEQLNGRAGTPTNLLVDKFGDAVDLTGTATPEHYRPQDGGGETGGYTLSQSFSTVGATKEEGEPNHAGQPGGASYWYSYTAPTNGTLQFNTVGSTFNTILAVYIGPGNSFSTLTNVGAAFTTNYLQQGQPVVVISNVVASNKYFVAIDGYLGASGAASLNIVLNPSTNVLIPTLTNNAPVVAITYPAENYLTFSSNITLQGTIKGSGAKPAELQVTLNINPPALALLGADRQGTIDWSCLMTLVPGANIITAQSMTVEGTNTNTVFASLPVTRTVFYDITRPSPKIKWTLTLLTNGHGKITGEANQASLEIGKIYTVTAVPIGNWVFAGWKSGTNTNSLSTLTGGANLAFDMSSNLILQASFITNPFTVVAGVYNGLFSPTNGVSGESSGFITATIPASSRGAYSAKVLLDGGAYPLSGTFNLSGNAEQIVSRSGKTPMTVNLQLTNEDQLTGSVSDITTNGWTSIIQADRADFNAKSNPATTFEGQYTLIIPGTTNTDTGPFGVSYGTVKVASSGTITLAGNLADGTPISQSTVVSQDGYWPLYVNLYGGKGLLWGWNYFINNNITNASVLSWINETNSSKTAVYRSGFTNQRATITGGIYAPSQSLPLGLTAIFEESNGPISPSKLTLRTNKTTGVISGGFAVPANSKQTIKFNGVILQGQTNAQGYFLGTNQSGIFLLSPP
ncbi:MAG: beta strand repeat-containing protein [Limisphaerales bacterium]